ncbi:MAG: hypothetical protein MKZ56_05990, partial [Candidatus Thalassarchaeum sp.]|nr:hypothetical protein [Candidatus Thalassarchaeum sp.]
LISIPDRWGVSTSPVHHFFKPSREVSIKTIISHVVQLARETGASIKEGMVERMVRHLPESTVRRLGIFSHGTESVHVHRDEPVFDGQFSNQCYQAAVEEAFRDFRAKAEVDGRWNPEDDLILTEDWARIIMHLPYAFQAKRMFPAVFAYERRDSPSWADVESEIGQRPNLADFDDTPDGQIEFQRELDAYRRRISKTTAYREFHSERIEKGQRASSLIGNQYTGSIFLALMSTFESDYEADCTLEGKLFGMCGYGSGAKAKVFEGLVSNRWREIVAGWNLFERMAGRMAIDQITYEKLHKGIHDGSVLTPRGEFALVEVGEEGVLEGARTYAWVD